MAQGQRVPQGILDEVETIWAKDPKLSAATIAMQINRNHVIGTISERKVRQVLRRLKNAGAGSFEAEDWEPWKSRPSASAA